MTWITTALGLLARIPGLGRWLERLGLVAGTAIVMRREQRHAQEIADAEAKLTRAQAEADAARAGRERNLAWMRANRPKSVQPIHLDRDPGTGRADRER
jgi:hypothetical protein